MKRLHVFDKYAANNIIMKSAANNIEGKMITINVLPP
jgi:hypothetical protein